MSRSPFKFLDSYTKDDRDIFFGRDREIEELYQKVFDSKLLLVYGVSGTGKSSLIHCGLANKFRETDWFPIAIRRGGNMIESMAASIHNASITPQANKFMSAADFKKGVRSLYLDHYKPVFFIFDQFEELFIFGEKEERLQFIHIVKALIDTDLQCRLIFVMREEYMAGVTEFERYIPTFFANRVRIEKMSHKNALETIKEPCKVFNISLEDGFAESLLEKLSPGNTDVELTYLQVFLDKVFRLAQIENGSGKNPKSMSFNLPLLDKIGNVSDLLGSFLDDQVSLMDDPDEAMTVLKAFVSGKGTKRPASENETIENVRSLGKEIASDSVIELILTFVRLRVLRDKDDHGRYELRHDSLAVKIFEKFTLSEKELLEVRKYVENAYYTFETRGVLLNSEDLEYLAIYDNKLSLPQTLVDFVNRSKEKLKSRRQALSRITRLSTLIFVLILVVVGRFYIKTLESSRVNDMFGLALIQAETNPVEGLITELKLWEKDSSATQLHSIILRDLNKLVLMQVDTSDPVSLLQEYLKPVKLESEIVNAELSKEGNYIFGWMRDQRVFVLNVTNKKINYFKSEGVLEQIQISEKDSALAIICQNNTGSVCDFNGKKRYNFETTLNELMNKKLVCFFPSGPNQLVAVKDNGALILDSAGRTTFALKGHSGRVNSVDVSPDGRLVVTASSDKHAYIWNYNNTIKQFSVYDSLVGHKDTIWSSRFNKTGKYVITASKDSTIKIWDLNGRQINPEFSFALNTTGRRYKTNNGEYDEDASNPYFSKFYCKFCDASFSSAEKEIIATGYTLSNDSLIQNKPQYHQVFFFDVNSDFPRAYGRSFFFTAMEKDTIIPKRFNKIIISPDEKVAAAVDSLSGEVYLLSGDGRRLLTLSGSTPMFANNGKELFWINKNEINRIPVPPVEIKRLLDKFKIPGGSRKTENNFVEI